MLQLLIRYVYKPVHRILLRTVDLRDPWDRFASHVPLHLYGKGANRDFQWYFQGDSSGAATSLDDIKEWLLGCEYVRDPDLFDKEDYWQHPCAFEQLKQGDCEDFSLWTWRRLIELGYEADFVVGHYIHPGFEPIGHSWLIFYHENQTYVFDPVSRLKAYMVRPLDKVADEYIPEFSVDRQFNRYVYAGYYLRRRGDLGQADTEALPVREAAIIVS